MKAIEWSQSPGFPCSLVFRNFALVIHDNHLLRMIEYTEIILISNCPHLQIAKLLIKINIFRYVLMLIIQSAEKSRLCRLLDVTG